MHSLYLNRLEEIADGSRHTSAINNRICAAFFVLPVYNQLLARYTHAPANVATNTTAIPSTIGAHDPPAFSGCHSQDLSSLQACQVVRKSYSRPHAACGYRVKLQHQGYGMTYARYEKSQ